MQKKFTITGTGATTPIEVGSDNQFTFASVGDQTDYSLDLEVLITDEGDWISAQTLVDSTVYSTVSGVRQVRFNCLGLGTATTIDVEINGAKL